jgi:hypothetical protein
MLYLIILQTYGDLDEEICFPFVEYCVREENWAENRVRAVKKACALLRYS